MSNNEPESNPNLDLVHNHKYPPYQIEKGLGKIVAFGDHSHKCPIYIKRTPPCTAACPAGEDIRGYHNILTGVEKSERKWEAAWRRIVNTNPFPSIMGRICPHPCESHCNRAMHDESVGINYVEHVIGDFAIEHNLQFDKPGISTGKQVAVIGGGPAGLSTAYQLVRKGHSVTIFEGREKLGGMMRYGIMGFRVDRKILDAEIDRIIQLGIDTRMNTKVGKDISIDNIKENYDAIFVGIGAQKGIDLPVEGYADSASATNAIEILKNFEKFGKSLRIGKDILVIGDGNVAMDVARLALRLGVSATVLSAVSRDDMGCYDEEFDAAEKEGANILLLVSISKIITIDGEIKSVKCLRMEKKSPKEEGYDSPVPFFRYKVVVGSEFTIDCDMVVSSIGQTTVLNGFESIIDNPPWVEVENDYKIKGKKTIFAGGDVIKIDLISTAVGHGDKAAKAIDAYLMKRIHEKEKFEEILDFKKLHNYYFPQSYNNKGNHLNLGSSLGNFDEYKTAHLLDSSIRESERCMSCGQCLECRQCMLFCPQEAVSYFRNNGVGKVMFTDYTKCVGCHICSEVCPTGYIQMGMGDGL